MKFGDNLKLIRKNKFVVKPAMALILISQQTPLSVLRKW